MFEVATRKVWLYCSGARYTQLYHASNNNSVVIPHAMRRLLKPVFGVE
jgi:hypothetical protein